MSRPTSPSNPLSGDCFLEVEKDIVPGANPAADLKIRKTIVHLREYLLDRHESDRIIRRSTGLSSCLPAVVAEAKKRKGIDKRDSYHCGRIEGKRVDDPALYPPRLAGRW